MAAAHEEGPVTVWDLDAVGEMIDRTGLVERLSCREGGGAEGEGF